MVEISSHVIGSFNASHRGYILVSAIVAHDSNRLDWEQHHKCLSDCSVVSGFVELFNHNVIRFLEYAYSLGCDLAQDTNGEAWTRKPVIL